LTRVEPPPKTIDFEVVEEDPGADPGGRARASRTAGGPPIHPLAALLLVVVDNLWLVPEFSVINWLVTVPLSFISVFVPTFLIQKLLKKDTGGRAFAFASLMAVIAAVPTSVTGTPVGLAILAWTGLNRVLGRPQANR